MTSKTYIDKLQIHIKEYPAPYSLQWLGSNTKVTTSRQALISFLIDTSNGEVLSDVLPMGACHLLLSRLWLYDNHVIYGGILILIHSSTMVSCLYWPL